ncbi:16S rRNA (cytidine(1402)-2'-O)-methyltransferase [Helicobacter salomonis]|uniref:16S rRNA (cytidine(1402)-2'-O)-methyltransferase n=1 Tax=Helicobacter salomonis TaxID=56878 RepID=UPI000CF1169A|nr:16S rRNA (cytidine(1402)-2'-O)-methyltransferase [Helicobacter salomonis]
MLSLLPTPIGNLKDMTLRALEVLARCDVLLCEDVRVTKRLLFLLAQEGVLKTPEQSFYSFHSHNQETFLSQMGSSFFQGRHVGFVSDAGMPCVSDPGARLVDFAQEHGIEYEVLPGASACVNAYSASGFTAKSFHFVGFLPSKNMERRAKIAKLVASCTALQEEVACVIYESPRRLLETLDDLASILPEYPLFAIKEMTKLHERRHKGSVLEVYQKLKALPPKALLGEWVLVCAMRPRAEPSLSYQEIADMDLPPKIKAKLLAKLKGISTKALYALGLDA